MNMSDLKNTILDCMDQVAVIADCTLIENISDDTVLLQNGLDSLGFAMLVAQLEEELGTDPFSEMELAVYPRTLGEFVTVYKNALS
ncbi:MAG: acyl carrier protein [Alteromonadaceae bacterium]